MRPPSSPRGRPCRASCKPSRARCPSGGDRSQRPAGRRIWGAGRALARARLGDRPRPLVPRHLDLGLAGCGCARPAGPCRPGPPKVPSGAAAVQSELAGSPAPLHALHEQAGQLLGTQAALSARLRALRGYPVVINAWASWCTPCRSEFGLLASASASYGGGLRFSASTPAIRPATPGRSWPSIRSAIRAIRAAPPRRSARWL